MKAIKKYIVSALLFVAAMGYTVEGKSQISLDSYYNIDWQFNIPMNNKFSNVASGWGMNFEGGYYVTQNMAVGAFINYHTNNTYLSRRTIELNYNSSVNTDQQHSIFQLPFGLLARYRFMEADFQPYIGLKLGAEYAQYNAYYYIFEDTKNTWGFTFSPEIGFNFYPWPNSIGFHMAIYYSFATNSCNLMSVKTSNISNMGVRVGFAL